MNTKICKNCGKEKEQTEFYERQGNCKECKLQKTHIYYREHRNYYHDLNKKRDKNVERIEARKIWVKNQNTKNVEKYRARYILRNAVRDGKIIREKCLNCDELKTEAHHTDYSQPLNVMWLCRKHHLEIEGKVMVV